MLTVLSFGSAGSCKSEQRSQVHSVAAAGVADRLVVWILAEQNKPGICQLPVPGS